MRALVLSLVATLAAARPAFADPAQYYEDALIRFDQGDCQGAVIQLKNALQEDPSHLPGRILLGECHLRVGNPAEAEKELLRARELGADEALVAVPLGKAYLQQRKYEALLDALFEAGHPPDLKVEILVLRGRALLELRQLEEADKTFREALELNPDHAPAMLGQAAVRLHQGDVEAAERLADLAAEAAPGDAAVWYVKGEIRRFREDLHAAVASYDKALALEPNHYSARVGRAASLIDLDRAEGARADIDFLLDANPTDLQALYLRALLAARTGDLEEARAAAGDAAAMLSALNPQFVRDHPPTLLIAGVLYYSQGHLEQAETHLRRFLDLVPTHPGARHVLATLLLNKGEPEEAAAILEPALELNPEDPQLLALLGSASMEQGRHEEAAALFERAIELGPGQTRLRAQLALTRLATGDMQRSIAELESSFAIDEGAVQPGILLSLLHMRNRDFEGAIAAARSVIERDPGNPFSYNLIGAAQLGKGDRSAARASFVQALRADPAYLPALLNLANLDAVEGRVDSAMKLYLALLENNSNLTLAMAGLSRLAERAGQIEEAIDWLEKLRATNLDAVPEIVHLVDLYIETDAPEKALSVAQQLEQRHPENLDVLAALGRAELAIGKRERARVTFRRMSKLAGFQSKRLHQIAAYQLAADDLDGAYWSLTKAAQGDPESLPVQADLVRAEAKLGRMETALERAVEMRDAHPEENLGEILMGDVLMQAGRFEDAAEAYLDAQRKRESSPLAVSLYQARRMAGDEEGALRGLEAWLQAHPQDFAASRIVADAHVRAGRFEAARQRYEQLLETAPEDPEILNNLAWLYLRMNDSRAIAYAEKAYQLAPERAAMLDTLGWALVQTGEPARGLHYLREARSRASLEPTIRYHIAVALTRLGRTDEARRELEDVLAAGQNFDGATDARQLLEQLGGG